MANRRKHAAVSKTASRKPEGFTDLLSKLEVEAEKVVRRFVEKAESSSRDLKKGISSLIQQIRNEGLASLAIEKTEEFRKVTEEVISRAREIQSLLLNGFNRDEIIREAKRNLDEVIDRLNTSELVTRARAKAINTKDQVLSLLSIPNQSDVVKLSKKITTLESRINKLSRKAA